MKSRLFLSFLVLVLVIPATILAQDIISVKELAVAMRDKNTVIVSCRKASDYKQVHIKGALNLYHKDLYKDGPVKSMLKSDDDLAVIIGKAGISNTNKIVLYDGGSGKYAGRVYWILKYLGCKDVKILDGHMDAWRKGRKPVTKMPSKVVAKTFTTNVNKSILASMADVKAGKSVLLDVRPIGEFDGSEGKTDRTGHIPGAKNMEFKKVMTDDGMIKSKDELSSMFNSAGITKDKEVILYCTSSVRAGIVFMVLTSMLDYPNVKVYDGAFYEWESVASNKVDK